MRSTTPRRLYRILAGLLALAGLVAAGPAATAADAAPRWVSIEGSDRLPAAEKLRYRIACRDACRVEVTARLVWPTRPNLVNRLQGHLRAGESRANVVDLNKVAHNVLQANFRRARLQVVVRATNRKTGRRGATHRTFRFTR